MFYQELGLEHHSRRRWVRCLYLLYKVLSTQQAACIHHYFIQCRNLLDIQINLAPLFEQNSVVSNWNRFDSDIRDSSNYSIFCKSLPKFIRHVDVKPYHINDCVRIKLLTRLRWSFSHLHKNQLRHNFKDTLNPLSSCSIEPVKTTHFFMHCHFYN